VPQNDSQESRAGAAQGVLGAVAGAAQDLAQRFAALDPASASPARVAQPLLDCLCELLPSIVTGFVLIRDDTGGFLLAAGRPVAPQDEASLKTLSERALTSRSTVVFRALKFGGTETRAHLIVAAPVLAPNVSRGVLVLQFTESSPAIERQARRTMDLAIGWLQAAFAGGELAAERGLRDRVRMALQALAHVQAQDGLDAAALQLATHLEQTLQCRRASVGVASRRAGIRIVALSNAVTFDRRADEVRRVQGAMEECFDQDETVLFPPDAASAKNLSLAHRALGGTGAVLSVALRSARAGVGVLTLERDAGRTFTADDVAACELLASLVAPALESLRERDRWFEGRLARGVRRSARALFGPRRPALKLATVLGLAALAAVSFVNVEYRVSSKAVVEGLVQRAAAAPFDGYISSANVRAGQIVHQGDLLATMDDNDLKLERARWSGERDQKLKQYNDAFAKHDRATAGVLAAQVEQADSQLALAEDNLERARIVAPLDGIVVNGDLSQLIGSPIEKGKVLFEIAPLENYRVVLLVDERDVAPLRVGQTGLLAMAGLVGSKVPFRIVNLTSVTSVEEGHNLFRIEAELLESSLAIRPGMEGVGKVGVGEHTLLWIGTHGFVDWLRLKAWTWLP
jgi:hypothetical protein